MRGVVPPRLRAAQAGISLVETLVALVLGLAMVSVAFNLYVSNRAVFRQIEAMVRLQESASIAAALLETSIRHAGGTLCRNDTLTTNLLDSRINTVERKRYQDKPYVYWQATDESKDHPIGLFSYRWGEQNGDKVVGTERLAGDSLSIMSDNMGAIARVTGRATHTSGLSTIQIALSPEAYVGLEGTYTFPVDNGLEFPVGTVAMACDHVRAVLFRVNQSSATGIQIQAGEGAPPSTLQNPWNCSVAMRKLDPNDIRALSLKGLWSCAEREQTGGILKSEINNYSMIRMHTFGPGSMIGEHTFEHWYIGRKPNTTDGLSLFRRRMVNASGTIGLGDAEEIAPDVTDMKITFLQGWGYTGYPNYPDKAENGYVRVDQFSGKAHDYIPFRSVTAVRIVLTLTSPEKVGLAATGAASAVTYTIPINVAIRAHQAGVVRR